MRKIAIDIGPQNSGDAIRGIGVYVHELSKHIKNVDLIDVKNAELNKYDVIHLTTFNPFRISIPLNKPQNTKFILTIYDLIPLIYPNHYPPGIKGWFNWQINKYLINTNVDAIITISETSKKDICRFIGINPSKVFVTYLAARESFRPLSKLASLKNDTVKKYNLPKRFALYVGDVNYNKNIPNLIKACELARISLVISGKHAKEIEKMNLNHPELSHLKNIDWSNVLRLGFVEDNDLVKIYNLASVYIQPSFYEGFGLPLLEAYECKTPIGVSKNQCHVEILGRDFDYFDPNNPKDIAQKILSPNMSKKLPRLYSWQNTANKTLEVYEKV